MHFENSHKKAQMIFWSLLCLFVAGLTHSKAQTVDPAGWGGNHVGKPIPEYVHGDECLFCHRNTIGATWQKNAHGVALRQSEDAPELVALLSKQPSLASVSSQIGYFLGSRQIVKDNFELVVVAIVLISLLPILWGYVISRLKRSENKTTQA